jgi:hypothetical protein
MTYFALVPVHFQWDVKRDQQRRYLKNEISYTREPVVGITHKEQVPAETSVMAESINGISPRQSDCMENEPRVEGYGKDS